MKESTVFFSDSLTYSLPQNRKERLRQTWKTHTDIILIMGLNSPKRFFSPPYTHVRNGVDGGLENTSKLNPYLHWGRDGNHVRVGPQHHVEDVEIPLESAFTPLVERVQIVEINSKLATQATGGNC